MPQPTHSRRAAAVQPRHSQGRAALDVTALPYARSRRYITLGALRLLSTIPILNWVFRPIAPHGVGANQRARVLVRHGHGEETWLYAGRTPPCFVALNIPSFGGGANVWRAGSQALEARHLHTGDSVAVATTAQRFDDARLEMVGISSVPQLGAVLQVGIAWIGGVRKWPQTSHALLQFPPQEEGNTRGGMYCQVDGEAMYVVGATEIEITPHPLAASMLELPNGRR